LVAIVVSCTSVLTPFAAVEARLAQRLGGRAGRLGGHRERLGHAQRSTLEREQVSATRVDADACPAACAAGMLSADTGPRVERDVVARPRAHVTLSLGRHLAAVSKSYTIIAVNSDPEAPIFAVARCGAVADLFEVGVELERRFS
jgi:hypothetical protein